MIRRPIALALMLAAAMVFTGCAGGRTTVTMEVAPRADTQEWTELSSAVLRVEEPEGEGGSLGSVIGGRIQSFSSRWTIAALVADSARSSGEMDCLPAFEVRDALIAGDLEPDLEPDKNTLRDFVEVLDCEAYLEMDLRRWQYRYILFWDKTYIEYTLTMNHCQRYRPLWSVKVRHRARGRTDREALRNSLDTTFRKLRKAGR